VAIQDGRSHVNPLAGRQGREGELGDGLGSPSDTVKKTYVAALVTRGPRQRGVVAGPGDGEGPLRAGGIVRPQKRHPGVEPPGEGGALRPGPLTSAYSASRLSR